MVCIASGFVGGYFAYKNASQLDSGSGQAVKESENLVNSIVGDIGQGVVSISIRSNQVSNTLFGSQSFETRSAGTGFIISDDGYIVTNRHVIPEGDAQISITLSNGDTLEDISVIDKTEEGDPLDIAFLKVNDSEGNDLTPVKIGSSNDAKVGDMVIAIGNALGQLQNTVTSGIISGFGRDVATGSEFSRENLVNLIQTDAAINQGNSGGPLVNASGEVIGINTAIAGDGAQNIGFAIPIDDIKGSIKSILENGELNRPFLGVRYVTLTQEIADKNDLNIREGAYLIGTESEPAIIAGSAAEEAGLEQGDVIIAIDGEAINTRNSLTTALGRYSAGDTIEIEVQRSDEKVKLRATLQEF